jgi:hypothetical protein
MSKFVLIPHLGTAEGPVVGVDKAQMGRCFIFPDEEKGPFRRPVVLRRHLGASVCVVDVSELLPVSPLVFFTSCLFVRQFPVIENRWRTRKAAFRGALLTSGILILMSHYRYTSN